MAKVLVVYGSRLGGTRGIAERIGQVLQGEGLDVEVERADQVAGAGTADAVVVGSGVYTGSWLKEPVESLTRNQAFFASRPLWLFSSGPLKRSSETFSAGDPIECALGPEDGPGSGGRKKVAELSAVTRPRDHRVFPGVFDPTDPPRAMTERLIRMMPASKGFLPPRDYRDWPEIEVWAKSIARELQPVGATR